VSWAYIGAPRDLVPTNEIYSFRDTLLTCLCHVLPKAFVFLLSTYSPSHCKIKGSIFKKYSLIGFHFVIFSFCIVYCNTPSFFKNMFARSTMYHLCSHLNIPFLLASFYHLESSFIMFLDTALSWSLFVPRYLISRAVHIYLHAGRGGINSD
jgi:hypothetical protein